MIWFTSDLHLGHANVLRFANRPWPSIEKMNKALIDSINVKVSPADELYILGDYSYKLTKELAAALRIRIRCQNVHLVPGNHDKDWSLQDFKDTFILEPPICQLKVNGIKIILSHYPLADWPAMSHGSWHLHGHIHSQRLQGLATYNELNQMQGILRYDVGVDANKYEPVSWQNLQNWFDGTASSGRIRWWNWVDQTQDAIVQAECKLIREQDENESM